MVVSSLVIVLFTYLTTFNGFLDLLQYGHITRCYLNLGFDIRISFAPFVIMHLKSDTSFTIEESCDIVISKHTPMLYGMG